MQVRERIVCVLVAALVGAGLALVGAPAPAPVPPRMPLSSSMASSLAPAVALPAAMEAPSAAPAPTLARDAEHPPAAPTPTAGADRDPLHGPPAALRVCWSPTAKRLFGERMRALFERDGTSLRTMVESDRGVLGRMMRGSDDVGLLAGSSLSLRDPTLRSRLLGYHVLAAVVHERRVLRDVPRHLLRAVAVGDAALWSHLGNERAEPIELVTVAEDAFTDQASTMVLLGQRPAASCLRLASDVEVCRYVAEHEGALGLCSLASAERIGSAVRVLSVDAVAPSAAAFVAGRYPFGSGVCALARDQHHLDWLDALPLEALSRAP